jgi:hypothetical protein
MVRKQLVSKFATYEYNVLKQYAKILHEQMIQDPETNQLRRMLEKPEIGLLIRNATYTYLVQYQYMMQQQAEIDAAAGQGQQVQRNG